MKINKKTTEAFIERLLEKTNIINYNFSDAQIISKYLGTHFENGSTQIGFWLPELKTKSYSKIVLEVFRSTQSIDFQSFPQILDFEVFEIPLTLTGEFVFAVIDGLQAGSKNQVGDFYWLSYTDEDGKTHKVIDVLADSIPFGIFSPAELYDMKGMFSARRDKEHFQSFKSLERTLTPVNILQLHTHTTTSNGTIEGLTTLFQTISDKLQNGQSLSKREKTFANYDGIQLLPVMPLAEKEQGDLYFNIKEQKDNRATVELRPFDIQNWGYDIVIAGASAINPALLGTKRPDELLHFIETLHHFHKTPKKVILDIVYGHADNQAQRILNKDFFLGAGMYGQEMNVRHPMVRAIMLESQRRIGNYGVDGFRVDAAQDIVYKDENGQKQYDNDYVKLMNEIVYEAGEVEYKTWMVYEDGRPWPKPDWNIATTYKEIHKFLLNAMQWSPLTFVNNKPLIFGFWIERFWRVRQIAFTGEMWVIGGSNHDTYRGLAHLNPSATAYNSYLGENLQEVAYKAYNNPAARLLDYAFMPGVTMEFINASTDTPWGFLRNTDYQWGVKVFAEETYFLDWFVNEGLYADSRFFQKLKAFGFSTYHQFKAFKDAVYFAVKMTDYDLPKMIKMLELTKGDFSIPQFEQQLREMAMAYMEDAYAYCNVDYHIENFSAATADFNYQIRAFRLERPHLIANLSENDIFDYWHSPNGAVVYYGWRKTDNEEILFIGNMEGEPNQIDISNFDLPNFDKKGWKLTLKTPDTKAESLDKIELKDSQAVVFVKI